MPDENLQLEGNQVETDQKPALPKCGIIMPISAIDTLSKEHWTDVQNIIKDVCRNNGFDPNLVSDADEVSVIQKTIVQNLYSNEIVVCDVSAKNPNVLFELGMRLAFDRPTIIIKDDKTDFVFDYAIVEHVPYPRDLRFNKIEEFKLLLGKKLNATFKKAADPNYTTFLKNFGEFTVAKLSEKEVSGYEFIVSELKDLRQTINSKIVRSVGPNKKSSIYDEASFKWIIRGAVERFADEYNFKNNTTLSIKEVLGKSSYRDLSEYILDIPLVSDFFVNNQISKEKTKEVIISAMGDLIPS